MVQPQQFQGYFFVEKPSSSVKISKLALIYSVILTGKKVFGNSLHFLFYVLKPDFNQIT